MAKRTERVDVYLDTKYVRAIYDLFRAGRLPPPAEIEELLMQFVESVMKQFPGTAVERRAFPVEEGKA